MPKAIDAIVGAEICFDLLSRERTQPSTSKGTRYYLQGLAVRKNTSTSTKLLVAFELSAKMNTNISFNYIFLKGPSIKKYLVTIMI